MRKHSCTYPIIIAFALFVPVLVYADTPLSIADARKLPPGTLVTVSGWVTASGHFSGPVFFQDDTAGMATFYEPLMRDPAKGFSMDLSVGDSIVVTGPVTSFNGQLQITPDENHSEVHYQIFPESSRQIDPLVITLAELNTGKFESQLVKIKNIRFDDYGLFMGDADYRTGDPASESNIRVSRFTDIPGMSIPVDEINLKGIAGRFNPGSNLDVIQLLPRGRSDFSGSGQAPVIISNTPFEVNASASSITFQWETDRPGTSEIRYGITDSYELGGIEKNHHRTSHKITLDHLEPATVYHVQLRSAYSEDTTRTSDYLVTTSSPEGTTQEINVYFNQNTDHSLATFEKATGHYHFAYHLMNRIDEAVHSLDLALYSISGSPGENIASTIIAAHNRGVRVRVIVDHNTNTDLFVSSLKNNGVAVIESNFGELNRNRDGIHHNKYAILDYNGGNPDEVWLITSSWNATDRGTYEHFQNMIEFQDVAIAGAFTREFNQKWGSSSISPNASTARFGSRKKIVNPSTFWIGDSYIRLFFSPQGHTETAIIDALNSADYTINLGTMLITRYNITRTLWNRSNQGISIRGVLGQPGQQNSQFEALASFADMHTQTTPLLHHKYAVIDGEKAGWNGNVITGSHNWSASANLRNDENTVIIKDSRIANLYIQEFSARYQQAGGQDDIFTVHSYPNTRQDRFIVRQNHPNPFNPTTRIAFDLPRESNVTIRIYDMLGREVAAPISDSPLPAGSHDLIFNGHSLAVGVYFYRIQLDDGQSHTRAMTLIK